MGTTLNAQNWKWSKNVTSNDNAHINDIKASGSGHIYITGSFVDSLQVGDSSFVEDNFYTAPFLAKYTTGGQFVWARHMKGTTSDSKGSKIEVGANGNVYVSGYARGGIDFGGQVDTVSYFMLTKFSSDGSFMWSKRAEGTHVYTTIYDMEYDGDRSLYLTGFFRKKLILDHDSVVTSSTYSNIFLTKIDTSGEVQWLRDYGIETNSEIGYDIALDGSDNIYLGATFSDSTHIKSTPIEGIAGNNALLLKLDMSDNLQWYQRGGGINNGEVSEVVVGNNGSVFMQGRYQSNNAYFGSDTLEGSNFSFSCFLAKYTQNGNYSWVKGIFGTDTEGEVLFPDNNGGCLAGGISTWDIEFEDDTTLQASYGPQSGWLAKYNDTGGVVNALLFDKVSLSGLHPVSNDRFFISASYGDSIKLGTSIYQDPVNSTYNGVFGLFTHTFPQFTGVKNPSPAPQHTPFTVYPNPTSGTLNVQSQVALSKTHTTVYLYNLQGERVKTWKVQFDKAGQTQPLPFNKLSPGMYFLQIKEEDGTTYSKRIIKQ